MVVLAFPLPTLLSMSPSTDSSCFSVTGARKRGSWLRCGVLLAMGEDSRGWLTTVEALGYTTPPHSF